MKLPQSSRRSVLILVLVLLTLVAAPLFARQQSLVSSTPHVWFGAVAVGASESQIIGLTNTSATSVTVLSVGVSGSEFAVSGVSFPLAINPGQSIPLSVTFTPPGDGWVREHITFRDSASNLVLQLEAGGSGVNSQPVSASPSGLSFGSVGVGSTTALSVVLTNSRNWSQTINSLGANGTGFLVTSPTLPLTLGPGKSVTLSVSFAPQSVGFSGGSILVSGPNVTIPVNGTGVSNTPGQLAVSPASLNFGNVSVGSSNTQPSSLSAVGGPVTISAENNANSEFQISGISLPVTIPAGQTLAFDVTFSPNLSGSTSSVLSFASNASNGQTSESLSGSGIAVQKSVDLTWNASSSSVAGYNVYRGLTAGTYAKVNSSLEPLTTYTDATVTSGMTYYYAATAVSASGQESGYSNPISVSIP